MSTLTSLYERLYGPRLVRDPENTGVEDWMLYLPLGFAVQDGVVRYDQRDSGVGDGVLP